MQGNQTVFEDIGRQNFRSQISFPFIILFIYAWLCRCFSSCSKQGLLFVAVQGLLTVMASLALQHRFSGALASVVAVSELQHTGSVVVAHWISCSVACGIFPGQGQNPCLLHWQADSILLSHQGSPRSQISNWGSDLASHLIFLNSDFQFRCEWIELES